MDRAVFFDRDGTIIDLVDNAPPRKPVQVKFSAYAVDCMKQLQNNGYKLFIVSNQPDIAKGIQTREQICSVHKKFRELIESEGVYITEYLYCYHHPDGTHPELGIPCECRKPKPGLILYAEREYNLDLQHSWMIGDKETDIECGVNAGVNTIHVNTRDTKLTLRHAADIISGGV